MKTAARSASALNAKIARCGVAFLFACATLSVLPRAASAQCTPAPIPPELQQPCTARYPRWTGELASLGVNSLVGGLSGGILQELRGGTFRDGFTRGAVGGSVIYVAKRVAAGEFDGAGFAGRELGSVGASIVRNAGLGRPSLSEIVLPLGVVRLYVQPKERKLRVLPDLTAIGWTLSGLQNDGLRLDARESLSAGTPVFKADNRVLVVGNDSSHIGGVTNSGVIFVANVPAFGSDLERINLKHERIHVLQDDQIFLTITDPVEDWALSKLPRAGHFLVRRVDVNLATTLLDILAGEMPRFLDRPWETEAVFRAR